MHKYLAILIIITLVIQIESDIFNKCSLCLLNAEFNKFSNTSYYCKIHGDYNGKTCLEYPVKCIFKSDPYGGWNRLGVTDNTFPMRYNVNKSSIFSDDLLNLMDQIPKGGKKYLKRKSEKKSIILNDSCQFCLYFNELGTKCEVCFFPRP